MNKRQAKKAGKLKGKAGQKAVTTVRYTRALISARAIKNDNALNSEKQEKFISDITPSIIVI